MTSIMAMAAFCGFATAVEFVAKSTSFGLFGVFDEENFVDDGDEVGDAGLLQRIGDRLGNEVGVRGRAANDHSKCDDGERLVLAACRGFDDDRNFKSSWNSNDFNFEIRGEPTNRFAG